jgi:hypothetical protein
VEILRVVSCLNSVVSYAIPRVQRLRPAVLICGDRFPDWLQFVADFDVRRHIQVAS